MVIYTLNKDRVFWKSAGENPGWFFEILVPAGVYKARTVELGFDKETDLDSAYWVMVNLPGTCVNGYIPGGHGTNNAEKYFGKPMDAQIQAYGYEVVARINRGPLGTEEDNLGLYSIVDDD